MKIVVFGASSSRHSINQSLALHAAKRLRQEHLPELEVETIALHEFDLPVFSVDREDKLGVPEAAHAFYEKIGGADGVIVSYAEHNGHYTAAFKNLFDWASRIDVKVFQGTPTLALSTSPGGRGAASVLGAAAKSASHFGCELVATLSVPRFRSVFDTKSDEFLDEDLEARLDVVIRRFAARLTRDSANPIAEFTPGATTWDERYSDEFVAYGKEANDFVRLVHSHIPDGPVLELAAGEGRNAVFLAKQGYDVTAMDQSAGGLANARALAEEHGVSIETVRADLGEFDFGENKWAGIVATWVHMPPQLRAKVHTACLKALRPGGVIVLEAYSPEQLFMPGLGGPSKREMLLDTDTAVGDFGGLELLICQETKRKVSEGRFHEGLSATTQVLAIKR